MFEARRDMKLIVACSSLDLSAPYSATPAWWQLLKALDECGVELAVTAYHGRVPNTPWWRAYPNPARLEGQAFAALRGAARRARRRPGDGFQRRDEGEALSQRLARRAAQLWVAPKWRRGLSRMLEMEGGADAVLLLSIPPNHLRGVAAAIRQRFDVPVLLYDGDVPASLPAHGGFTSGFDIYRHADLSEFDAVLSNSKGGAQALRDLGAAAVHTLYYAADPDLYRPLSLPQDIDVLFYGHTAEYRAAWIQDMLTDPAARMPEARFAVRASGLGTLDQVEQLPYRAFNTLRRYIARSRINLVIVRQPHAELYGSSILRPFELAMMGACMVCNPWLGVEQWFEPDEEIVVVHSAQEAVDRYRYLLSHEAERKAIGQAARKRALSQHTYRRRAEELVQILKVYP